MEPIIFSEEQIACGLQFIIQFITSNELNHIAEQSDNPYFQAYVRNLHDRNNIQYIDQDNNELIYRNIDDNFIVFTLNRENEMTIIYRPNQPQNHNNNADDDSDNEDDADNADDIWNALLMRMSFLFLCRIDQYIDNIPTAREFIELNNLQN